MFLGSKPFFEKKPLLWKNGVVDATTICCLAKACKALSSLLVSPTMCLNQEPVVHMHQTRMLKLSYHLPLFFVILGMLEDSPQHHFKSFLVFVHTTSTSHTTRWPSQQPASIDDVNTAFLATHYCSVKLSRVLPTSNHLVHESVVVVLWSKCVLIKRRPTRDPKTGRNEWSIHYPLSGSQRCSNTSNMCSLFLDLACTSNL